FTFVCTFVVKTYCFTTWAVRKALRLCAPLRGIDTRRRPLVTSLFGWLRARNAAAAPTHAVSSLLPNAHCRPEALPHVYVRAQCPHMQRSDRGEGVPKRRRRPDPPPKTTNASIRRSRRWLRYRAWSGCA